MKELSFECTREMHGDKAYATGDTRQLTAVDAVHLVRSGALVPKGAEAKDAMEKLLGDTPAENFGIVHGSGKSIERKDAGDADRNKDAGNADRNKDAGDAGRTKAPPAKAPAKPAGKAKSPAKAKAADPAAGDGAGEGGGDDAGDGAAGGAGDGGEGGAGGEGGGDAGSTGGAAATGKRR